MAGGLAGAAVALVGAAFAPTYTRLLAGLFLAGVARRERDGRRGPRGDGLVRARRARHRAGHPPDGVPIGGGRRPLALPSSSTPAACGPRCSTLAAAAPDGRGRRAGAGCATHRRPARQPPTSRTSSSRRTTRASGGWARQRACSSSARRPCWASSSCSWSTPRPVDRRRPRAAWPPLQLLRRRRADRRGPALGPHRALRIPPLRRIALATASCSRRLRAAGRRARRAAVPGPARRRASSR